MEKRWGAGRRFQVLVGNTMGTSRMLVCALLVLNLLAAGATDACSLSFTAPARGSTVVTAQVGVAGTGSGTANQGDVGQVTATLNGVPFFQQSGTFTNPLVECRKMTLHAMKNNCRIPLSMST